MLFTEVTGSTNTDLLAAAADGIADRTVLRTGHQTAGRGRLDRRWDAPPGTNLLTSILFRDPPDPPGSLPQRIGLAIVAAVRTVAPEVDVRLKWPNDVLLGDRKLAGILAQAGAGPDGRMVIVVGFGVNVGWAPEGAAAGRRRFPRGDDPDPGRLLEAVLTSFDELPTDAEGLRAAYLAGLDTLGRAVRVDLPDGESVTGTAVDVETDGRLVVEHGGVRRAFAAGDVVHLRTAH